MQSAFVYSRALRQEYPSLAECIAFQMRCASKKFTKYSIYELKKC